MSYESWHDEPGYWRDVVDALPEQGLLLDVGCGTAWLGGRVNNYLGIERSMSALRQAHAAKRRCVCANIEDGLPVATARCDTLVLKDVLEHLERPWALVAECRRVLRRGGVVLASAPDAQRHVWDDYTHRRPFTRKSLRRLFEDQGFLVERVSYEAVFPGIETLSRLAGRYRRPPGANLLARLGWVRRNVVLRARRESS